MVAALSPHYLWDFLLHGCCPKAMVLLKGDDYNPKCSIKHQKRSIQRTYSEELLDAEDYNSSKYLNDLDRHKQLALSS